MEKRNSKPAALTTPSNPAGVLFLPREKASLLKMNSISAYQGERTPSNSSSATEAAAEPAWAGRPAPSVGGMRFRFNNAVEPPPVEAPNWLHARIPTHPRLISACSTNPKATPGLIHPYRSINCRHCDFRRCVRVRMVAIRNDYS